LFTNTGIISSPFPITALIPTEEWTYKAPVSGDHIRVDRGLYTHHGIHISEDEVIHFSSEDDDNLAGTDNKVLQTNLDGFLRGGKLEVKIYTEEEIEDLYHADAIVSWARACLGDDGYNLVFNNCEHFANYCTLGRHHSHQVSKTLGGGVIMGWLGDIGRAIFGGGSSRDSSSTTTTYEPDKVRVAEIEASVKVKLAGMEQERIKLYAETQMELAQFNAEMEARLLEAKFRSETALQKSLHQSILDFQREVNILAEQRMALLTNCSFDVVKQIEGFYLELKREVMNDLNTLNSKTLPTLYELLSKYDEGSDQYKSYLNSIDQQKEVFIEFVRDEIKALRERQTQRMASSEADKLRLDSHINLLVEKRMEQIGMSLENREQLQLAGGQPQQQIAQQLRISGQNIEATD
jgi:hypothetical protein